MKKYFKHFSTHIRFKIIKENIFLINYTVASSIFIILFLKIDTISTIKTNEQIILYIIPSIIIGNTKAEKSIKQMQPKQINALRIIIFCWK